MYARTIAQRINAVRGKMGINLRVVAKIRNSRPRHPGRYLKAKSCKVTASDKRTSRVLERDEKHPTRRSLTDSVLECRSLAVATTDNVG